VESAEGKTSMPFKVPGAKLALKTRQWLVVGHLVIINLVCLGEGRGLVAAIMGDRAQACRKTW